MLRLRPSRRLAGAPIAAVLALAACAPADAPDASADGPSSEALAAVRPPATFRGTLPCADCPGVRTTLTLSGDGTATLSRLYIEGEPERDPVFEASGRWGVDDAGRLTVTASDDETLYFAFDVDGLAALGADGRPLPSDLPRVLARVPDGPGAALAGTAWRFVDPAPAGGEAAVPTARFSADGRLTGSDGCNAFTGPWRASEEGGLDLGPLASTRRACPGDADATARAVANALAAAAGWSLDAEGGLTLHDETGEAVARLRPSP